MKFLMREQKVVGVAWYKEVNNMPKKLKTLVWKQQQDFIVGWDQGWQDAHVSLVYI